MQYRKIRFNFNCKLTNFLNLCKIIQSHNVWGNFKNCITNLDVFKAIVSERDTIRILDNLFSVALVLVYGQVVKLLKCSNVAGNNIRYANDMIEINLLIDD